MRNEIQSAVDFVSSILRGRIEDQDVDSFRQVLEVLLCTHYQNHWFPEKPFKGSAYRCLRINHKMDPLISQAGNKCGLTDEALFRILPNELTLWVDPNEVSYRIGEDGSIGVLCGEGQSDSETETTSPMSSNQSSPVDNEMFHVTDQLCSYDYYFPEQTGDNYPVSNMEYLATRVAS